METHFLTLSVYEETDCSNNFALPSENVVGAIFHKLQIISSKKLFWRNSKCELHRDLQVIQRDVLNYLQKFNTKEFFLVHDESVLFLDFPLINASTYESAFISKNKKLLITKMLFHFSFVEEDLCSNFCTEGNW